ncbi:MAG: 2,3,4,5-tetrahydropyridine-2,6-dicarboxylate N-succinyltransferase [Rhodospirillales bacterium]|nr:2,3,4,5-tetrahydropyridine-2,6-dicarboxylate N-succinyltransferase [Alphaproteobacteria bacterium]MCB9986047.1 2,3,4,5-tetrahydropyridine-2,6-dicarboxylate N-succinyltransferase [Rhodospirillales bacterium]USO07382.1 MAG: 2,3,4,5-tetrahydropyridine-2,6-dicarboxylate N-succinyltransferase [Rhodospirillales bacterium]
MTSLHQLRDAIERAHDAMLSGGPEWQPDAAARDAVESVITALDDGSLRAVRLAGSAWEGNDWVRRAILLYFRANRAVPMPGAGASMAFDKIPLKTENWDAARFHDAGFRMVPGAIVRRGAYIGRSCVLMPCFVNIGAHVGDGTMVDTWATIGSCAQIGRNVHVSGGAGIGGVLEPVQARPVIVGDRAFIGARCEIAEGVEIGEGAVIAMGTYISASTKIVDRATGAVTLGRVPPFAVVVPGTLPAPNGGPALACGVIVKTVDSRTRDKTGINDLLRAA